MSFEWIADLMAIVVLIAVAGVYLYGRRHFEPSGSEDAPGPSAREPRLLRKIRVAVRRSLMVAKR